MPVVKIIQRVACGGRGGGARTCQAPGCPSNTREGKPYCLEHIDQSHYAAGILAELARREHERAQLKKCAWVGVDSHYVKEVLSLLYEHGEFTAGYLTRALDLDMEQATALLLMMGENGLVRTGRTSRGTITAARI